MAKIIGGTATSSMLVPDWNQTNPNRADYIKNKPDVANPIKGVAVVLNSAGYVSINDFSPFRQELTIKCTRYEEDGSAVLKAINPDSKVFDFFEPDKDGYIRGFYVSGESEEFFCRSEHGDFQIEYNKDTNKAMGDVEAALDAIIAMQNQLIGGDSE